METYVKALFFFYFSSIFRLDVKLDFFSLLKSISNMATSYHRIYFTTYHYENLCKSFTFFIFLLILD